MVLEFKFLVVSCSQACLERFLDQQKSKRVFFKHRAIYGCILMHNFRSLFMYFCFFFLYSCITL